MDALRKRSSVSKFGCQSSHIVFTKLCTDNGSFPFTSVYMEEVELGEDYRRELLLILICLTLFSSEFWQHLIGWFFCWILTWAPLARRLHCPVVRHQNIQYIRTINHTIIHTIIQSERTIIRTYNIIVHNISSNCGHLYSRSVKAMNEPKHIMG